MLAKCSGCLWMSLEVSFDNVFQPFDLFVCFPVTFNFI